MSTCTITLDPEIEQRVRKLAEQHNVTIDEYVNDTLKLAVGDQNIDGIEPGTMSGAEMLEYLERESALYRTELTEDSGAYARRLREQAQRREFSGIGRPNGPAPGTLSGAEMIEYWRSVGAFVDRPLTEDSVDIVNRMREQTRDRWKA